MREDDRERQLARVDALADWLDGRFRVPGTSWRFGVDALIGLLPGVGDVATALIGLALIGRAREAGAPTSLALRMAANVGLDALVGAVPVLGDLFDVAFKANQRNARLLRTYLERHQD